MPGFIDKETRRSSIEINTKSTEEENHVIKQNVINKLTM